MTISRKPGRSGSILIKTSTWHEERGQPQPSSSKQIFLRNTSISWGRRGCWQTAGKDLLTRNFAWGRKDGRDMWTSKKPLEHAGSTQPTAAEHVPTEGTAFDSHSNPQEWSQRTLSFHRRGKRGLEEPGIHLIHVARGAQGLWGVSLSRAPRLGAAHEASHW